jgi:cytochrome bd ubiquinol oxidase subunit II
MELAVIWFILIAILFIGFFFLEGFDFGVGILLPFVGRDDVERQAVIRTIGPHWDANEVWLITAGGAMLAAFPHWYATLFSAFYLPLALILLGLIVRAVGIEFRAKMEHRRWRLAADTGTFLGSLIPALLWGVAFSNIVRGIAIDETMNYTGTFWDLLNPFALLGGLVSLSFFTLHGAYFLALRTEGELHERAWKAARILWIPTAVVLTAFAIISRTQTALFEGTGVVPSTIPMLAIMGFFASFLFTLLRRDFWAFMSTSLTIIFGTSVIFAGLFPRVMLSSLGPEFDLTIYNASSTNLTLAVMLGVAILLVPIVVAYQGWTYWIFRERITREAVETPG